MKQSFTVAAGLLAVAWLGLNAQAPVPTPVKPATVKPATGKPATGNPVEYSAGQSAAGKAAYDQNCLSCHGRTLDNGEVRTRAARHDLQHELGGRHRGRSGGLYIDEDAAGRTWLAGNARAYAGIVAYILQSNNIPSGLHEMPRTRLALPRVRIPGAGQSRAGGPGGGLTPGVALPNHAGAQHAAGPDHAGHRRHAGQTSVRMAHLAAHLRRPGLQPAQTNRPDQREEPAPGVELVAATRPEHRDPLEHDGVLFVQG